MCAPVEQTESVPEPSITLLIALGRDAENHLAGWVSQVDGTQPECFVGTLELLRRLIDRVDAMKGGVMRQDQ